MLSLLGIGLAAAGIGILFASRLPSGQNQQRDAIAAGIVVSLAGLIAVLVGLFNRAI